ncbi:MAG: Bax inhibitor-1/YccA family protein [Leptospiraceae bacterium]|nr:Bax inhibitor-1/YccA family protein [Leptospiraceae bacterium]MCP5496131.1 Bax inhibitor-1/YccA family protein [Leptospiraceae bacterium]
MRTSNPILQDNTFKKIAHSSAGYGNVMTLDGTVNKVFVLFLLFLLTAAYTWHLYFTKGPEASSVFLLPGIIGGLVIAITLAFKQSWAPVLAPAYAIFEGLAIGAISAFFEAIYQGIVMQAVGLTFGTMFTLLFAYKTGIIRATENFKLMVVAATGGIAIIYLVSFAMSFFGTTIPYIHQGGWIGIGFSFFVVSIAALNLVLDFDFIESGAKSGAPKFMEWYAAFGLMVTLVWLYLEILKLLAKLRGRD